MHNFWATAFLSTGAGSLEKMVICSHQGRQMAEGKGLRKSAAYPGMNGLNHSPASALGLRVYGPPGWTSKEFQGSQWSSGSHGFWVSPACHFSFMWLLGGWLLQAMSSWRWEIFLLLPSALSPELHGGLHRWHPLLLPVPLHVMWQLKYHCIGTCFREIEIHPSISLKILLASIFIHSILHIPYVLWSVFVATTLC